MSTSSRPVFPSVLTAKTAAQFVRELTRWVGPGFHPETDFHEYVSGDGSRSYSSQVADELNAEFESAASMLEAHGIDPCEIGLPEQRKLILQMMYRIEADVIHARRLAPLSSNCVANHEND
jgi:hypothetical protein